MEYCSAIKRWCFQTVVLEKTLESPLDCRKSDQSILKEINPEYSLEGRMLKLQYFGHLNVKNWLIGKDPDAGEDWGQEEKGATEDEMVGWHTSWLNGDEFEQTLGDSEGQGSLACCSPWGQKELDTTERLKYSKAKGIKYWYMIQYERALETLW